LIRYGGTYWRITKTTANSGVLQSWEGSTVSVNHDHEDLGPEFDIKTWPYAMSQKTSSKRRIRKLVRTVQGKFEELVPYLDWAPANYLQNQGPIFFNPNLKLKLGEVLVLHYDCGSTSRVTIPVVFKTALQHKKAIEDKEKAKKDSRKVAFSKILSLLDDVEVDDD